MECLHSQICVQWFLAQCEVGLDEARVQLTYLADVLLRYTVKTTSMHKDITQNLYEKSYVRRENKANNW